MTKSSIREVVDIILAETGNSSATPIFHSGKELSAVPGCLFVGRLTVLGSFPGVALAVDVAGTLVHHFSPTGNVGTAAPPDVCSFYSARGTNDFTFVGYRVYCPAFIAAPAGGGGGGGTDEY
jgi:hypothetical protein